MQYKQKKDKPTPVEKSFSLKKNVLLNTAEEVPDLSTAWIDPNLTFVPYLPSDNYVTDNIVNSDSNEVLNALDADLSALLKKRYHEFWSTVLFDESFLKFLDSFLRYFKRNYDTTGGELTPLHKSIFIKVLKSTSIRYSKFLAL